MSRGIGAFRLAEAAGGAEARTDGLRLAHRTADLALIGQLVGEASADAETLIGRPAETPR
jgi:hypothetical protein